MYKKFLEKALKAEVGKVNLSLSEVQRPSSAWKVCYPLQTSVHHFANLSPLHSGMVRKTNFIFLPDLDITRPKKTRRNSCKEAATWQNCRRNVRVWPPNISGRTLHANLHSQQSTTPAVMWTEIWKMYVPQTTHDSCALALLTSPANLDERTEWEPNKNLERRI